MRKVMTAAVVALALGMTAPAFAGGFTTADTDIGTLLDNPATKAILDKLMPGFSTNEQVQMARPMTLRAVQQFAPNEIKTEVLDQIDAEFTKLPAQ
jgi:hypothetical protein